jgi:hypothetical protein
MWMRRATRLTAGPRSGSTPNRVRKGQAVLLLMLAAVAMLTVPLAGGSLARLADLRFRHAWLPALAIAVQILLI